MESAQLDAARHERIGPEDDAFAQAGHFRLQAGYVIRVVALADARAREQQARLAILDDVSILIQRIARIQPDPDRSNGRRSEEQSPELSARWRECADAI